MKSNKVDLSVVFVLCLVFSNFSFAHSSDSFFTQLIHSATHAHHAYAGLFFVVAVVAMVKLKKHLIKQNKVLIERKKYGRTKY